MQKRPGLAFVTALGLLACSSVPAAADPAAFLGLTYSFGGANSGKFGVTARVFSSDKKEEWVAAAGVTYYLSGGSDIGLDVGAGYSFDNVGVVIGFDLLQATPVGSVGWSDTK